LDVDDGREIGIADPVIFAGLRRSLDETNRKIALGQIDPSAIERYTISLIARTRCLPRDLNGAAAGVGTLNALLGGFGKTGAPAVIAAVTSGLFWYGSSALTGFCDPTQRGARLTILWVGLPFCRSL
jgi:hypothetical protein